MANYPAALPSSTPTTHGTVNDELVAIATTLGVNPQGTYADVAARLGGFAQGALDGRYEQLPAAADKVVFVSARGNDSNDGRSLTSAKATLAAAVTALAGPGVIQLGAGQVVLPAELSLAGSVGVTIRGVGGQTAGGSPASQITFTGTGAGAAINAQNSIAFTLQDVMLTYSNSLFTGRLVDLRNANVGSDTVFGRIQGCYLGATGGITTAFAAVDLDRSHSTRIVYCSLRDCTYGIAGKSAQTSYSNVIHVTECYFRNNVTAHILNPGQGWVVEACTWEPLVGGKAGALACQPGVLTEGLTILGGWCGDVTANAGGIQFDVSGFDILILGAYIGINTGATGVRAQSGTNGLCVVSRFAGGGGDTGIDINTSIANVDVARSTFTSVGTPFLTGGNPLWSISSPVSSGPTAAIINSGQTTGGAMLRYQANKTSIQQYDVGIDPAGGVTKRWQVRDVTAAGAPIRLQVTPTGSVIQGVSAPTTTATDGFDYIPVMSGTPTGVPTAETGYAPIVLDSTGLRLWVYIGGAWKSAALA